MADLKSSMSLNDRVSPVLKQMLKAMDATLKAMKQMDSASDKGVVSKAFKQAEKDIQRANNALKKMGNHAEMGNSKAQEATKKTIRQMNLLEVAALSAGKAMSKVSSLKNFSLSDKFTSMQAKGTNMLQTSNMLNATRGQALKGAALQSFGALGSTAITAFSIAKNSVTDFASFANNALTSVSNRANMAWQTVASGIYTVKNVASALSSLTGLTDKVTSDMAKLNLQNYSNITSGQAYGLAYQAAQASRSDISTTSNLAGRIAMSGVYGKGQGSLENSINMAETISKALVLGGGTEQENQRALLQLSQGLSSGLLQGDELRSIREQSPYLADMLAQGLAQVDSAFAGVTAGDLKKLGSEGKLTSAMVIKAFEAMEEQIDKTFEAKAPRTWGQGITSITNTIKFFMGILQQMEGGPLQKITNLIWTIADYLRSPEGLQILAGVATILGVIGDVLSFVVSSALKAISWLMDNAQVLIAIFAVLGAVALASGISALIGWLMAIWPLLLMIAIVALIIDHFVDLGYTFEEIVGAMCGGIMVVVAAFKNLGIVIWGTFKSAFLWIKSGFQGLMSTVIGFIAKIAEKLSALPFIDWDYKGLASDAKYWADQQAKTDEQRKANEKAMEGAFAKGWVSDAYNTGFEWGSGLVEGLGETALNLESMFDPDKLGAGLGVEVTGGNLDSVGSIKGDVDISDEDVKLLRDMAARDYLLQLQTITPVAKVTFGDVRETADVNKIVEVIEDMVEQQMATSLVG